MSSRKRPTILETRSEVRRLRSDLNAEKRGVCLLIGIAFTVATALSSNADASCSRRPGTPNEERAVAISDTEISYSWRVTDDGDMYYDMYVLGPRNENVGKNRTGDGPYPSRFGRRAGTTFSGLRPNTRYCFAIRARTEGGTEGCVSKNQSSLQCTVTMAHPPYKPWTPPPPPAGPGGPPAQGPRKCCTIADPFSPGGVTVTCDHRCP